MTKALAEIAREATNNEPIHCRQEFTFSQKQLERFAALVIANHPPQSYMTWQDGCEAGKLAEREAIAKWLRDEKDAPYWAELIQARGDA